MTDFVVRDATVLATEPGALLVRMDEDAEECGGCGTCAVKALCRGRDGAHFDMRVPVSGERNEKAGDRVRVAYRGANPAVASLVMFLPALVGVVFGGFLTKALLGGGDGIFLLGAFGGLALGFGATFLLARRTSLRPEARLAEAGER